MGTEFGVAPRRIRPSLDFGVDKIMRYGVGTIPLSPSGVGNSKTGVGPVFGEWMEWGRGYEVEIVVWEWGIRSGGVGVGVFIMPLQSHTLPHSIVPHSPIPHSTHIQSIPNQSNSAVSSHKDCVSISVFCAGSGTNDVGTINSLSLGVGQICKSLPARYCCLTAKHPTD